MLGPWKEGQKAEEPSGMVARVGGLEITSQAESWPFHLLTVNIGQLALPFCASVSSSIKRASTGEASDMSLDLVRAQGRLADTAICDGGDGRCWLTEAHLP